jgi:CheY-like chemotaxis protein
MDWHGQENSQPLSTNCLCVLQLFARSLNRVAPPSWQVRDAANGETALELVDSGQQFVLILLDQYMSSSEQQLLGTETARALRSKGVTSIIRGLSANDIESSFLDDGANAFVLKPFPSKPDELKRCLARILQHYSVSLEKSSASSSCSCFSDEP